MKRGCAGCSASRPPQSSCTDKPWVEARQVGARPMSVRIQLELSRLLVEVDESARARALLDEARIEADGMGLAGLDAEIEQLLADPHSLGPVRPAQLAGVL